MATADNNESDTPLPDRTGRCYGLVFIAAGIAVILDAVSDITVTIKGDDFILLAIFYVVAQATERLVEPLLLQNKVAPQTADLKADVSAAKTDLAIKSQGGDMEAANAAAAKVKEEEKELTDAQKQRAVIGWALASSFALVVCGLLGLGLIGSVATVTADGAWGAVFSRVDVVVTGLAVGAGTKPLHDLISRIEKSKEKADPATDAAVVPNG